MPLSIGDTAPNFTVNDTNGKPISLSDYAGKPVVIYFYPKDDTPGCTTEGSNFASAHTRFTKANAVVFGVSRDGLKSHESFKSKMKFPFELISDPDEALCNLFGVMKMKNMYGKQVRGVERRTFVIDGSGKLRREWRGVKVPNHVDDVLAVVKSLA